MELIVLVALLAAPVLLVAVWPRMWPLVVVLGVGVVASWAIWNYSKRDEFDEFYGELIPVVGGAFLLLWLLGCFAGNHIGRRRTDAR